MKTSSAPDTDTHDHIARLLFSTMTPGSRLVERQLASELGLGRVPVRETLTKLVAQGVLVGGSKGQGVSIRQYTPREVRQLYEYREMIEGGVARAAARFRTEDDLALLEAICDQMAVAIENYTTRWADLDRHFHDALAAASHHERFIHAMKAILSESYYVFFGRLAGHGRQPNELAGMRKRVMHEHRSLVEQIRRGDADAAERTAREHMRHSADCDAKSLITNRLNGISQNGSREK